MAKISDDHNTGAVRMSYSSLLSVSFIAVIAIVVIAAGWFAVKWFYAPGNFPIRKIELVKQLKHQKSDELQQVAANAIDGGFFSMNVDVFREKLLLLPWVENVSVRKVWPNKLLVSITERTPASRWLSLDEQRMNNKSINNMQELNTHWKALLSNEGVIFSPEITQSQRTKFMNLPLFSGPNKSAHKVLQQCIAFLKIIKSMDITMQHCAMDARHAWKIELASSLIVNLGKYEVMKRLQRFVDVFSQQLNEYLPYVRYADLRYSNGFSVKWNSDLAEQADGMRLN